MKSCSKCKEEKPITHFSVTKRNEDGSPKYRNSWCNKCRTSNNRVRLGCTERKMSTVDYNGQIKECNHCGCLLPFCNFSKSSRGSAGLGAYCKKCEKERYYDKEKAKLATQSYRNRNRNRWRALHRINQFNRRSLIKASEDGTVTAEFIDSVYRAEVCYWCKEYITEENRTLEHIIELGNGGPHSASNITMACFSCNSSRFNRGVKEDV